MPKGGRTKTRRVLTKSHCRRCGNVRPRGRYPVQLYDQAERLCALQYCTDRCYDLDEGARGVEDALLNAR